MTLVESLNLYLDALLKTVLIGLGVYTFYLLRNLNSFVQAAEKSVRSVEESAEVIERSVRWGRILPFIGGKSE